MSRVLSLPIIDRREIEFDADAMKAVVACSPQAAQAFGLPPLVPDAVRCNATDGQLEVVYGTLNATRVFALRAEAFGAILVSYCNRTGMPMPRYADKGIRVERDRVILVFSLRIEQAPAPDLAESNIGRAPEAVRAWHWFETPHA